MNSRKFYPSIFIFLLLGCNSTPKSTDLVQETNSYQVEMFAFSMATDQTPTNVNQSNLLSSLSEEVKEQCKMSDVKRNDSLDVQKDNTSAFLIPLIATVAKHVVEAGIKRNEKNLEELKKRSSKSYSHTIYTTSNDLKGIDCIVIRRTNAPSPKITPDKDQFIAVIKLVRVNDEANAFYFRPIHISAKDAIVPTLAKTKSLTISIAISVKSIGIKDNGLRVVDELGSSVVSVGGVKLANEPKCAGDKKCASSQMLPFSNGTEPVSITVAITETGDLGIDFDKKIAEIQALKEAYGSAIFEGVKAGLADD